MCGEQLLEKNFVVFDERITPACAGNRNLFVKFVRVNQDHPRVCGEQHNLNCQSMASQGSPPRVRGTEFAHCTSFRRSRITPACAGNSRSLLLRHMPSKDHPRVCGEQLRRLRMALQAIGSPPRVRGTGHCYLLCTGYLRITPACAGNSDIELTGSGQNRDHPRVCGEQC